MKRKLIVGLILSLALTCQGCSWGNSKDNISTEVVEEFVYNTDDYEHCDEIMLFYPDGNYEYIYLYYDFKDMYGSYGDCAIVYKIKNPDGVMPIVIAYIADGTLFFKDGKDYMNDGVTYTSFSGTFYADNIQ